MADSIGRRIWHTGDFYFNPAKVRERCVLRRIVGEQILRPEFVADLLESLIELRDGGRVIVLPPCVLGKLDQGMLAASFASRAAFNRNNDNRIDQRFGLFGSAYRFF